MLALQNFSAVSESTHVVSIPIRNDDREEVVFFFSLKNNAKDSIVMKIQNRWDWIAYTGEQTDNKSYIPRPLRDHDRTNVRATALSIQREVGMTSLTPCITWMNQNVDIEIHWGNMEASSINNDLILCSMENLKIEKNATECQMPEIDLSSFTPLSSFTLAITQATQSTGLLIVD